MVKLNNSECIALYHLIPILQNASLGDCKINPLTGMILEEQVVYVEGADVNPDVEFVYRNIRVTLENKQINLKVLQSRKILKK